MSSRSRLSSIGPAILLTATSIGAGDILTGSLAGSHAGLAVLWAVPAGVALKWTLTEGIARWQMATGTTLLEGWVRKLGAWFQWVFLAYLMLCTVVTAGMLASACGIVGGALAPLGGLDESRLPLGVIHSLTPAALVWGGYEFLKKVLASCIGAMVAAVTLTAVLLQPHWTEVVRGLIPSDPAANGGWVVRLIGAIGGTIAILSHGYWIREEGSSGREGLEACRFDLLLSSGPAAVGDRSADILRDRRICINIAPYFASAADGPLTRPLADERRNLSTTDRRRADGLHKPRYFVITPHAIRSPALPAGSDFMSSGFAWITKAVPPLTNSEWSPPPKFTRGYITKKSPRNVQHGVLEPSLTMSRVFSKFEFFDYTNQDFFTLWKELIRTSQY